MIIDKMRGWKKAAALILIAALSALIVDGCWWFLAPGGYTYSQSGTVRAVDLAAGDESELLPEERWSEGNGPKTKRIYPLDGTPIGSIVVRLPDAVTEERFITIACAPPDVSPLQVLRTNGRMTPGTKEIGIHQVLESGASLMVITDEGTKLESISISDGTVTKHRNPYRFHAERAAILFVCISLALFLLFYVPAVRKGLQWLDLHVFDPQTRARPADILFIVLSLIFLLHHIYITLIYKGIVSGADLFPLAWVLFSIACTLFGKMWRRRDFWLLAALWLLYFLRLAVPDPDRLTLTNILITGFYAIFGCYSVGAALKEKDRHLYMKLFCGAWTISASILCGLGVYVCYTGNIVYNLSHTAIEVIGGRLNPIYMCITGGSLASVSAMLALYAMSLVKKSISKVLYLLAALMMILTNALTATRTGFIMNGIGISMMICVLLWTRVGRQAGLSKARKMMSLFPLFLCFIILAAGLTYAQTFLLKGFMAVRSQNGLLIRGALAEEAAPAAPWIADRGFEGYSTLDSFSSGRVRGWEGALRDLTSSRSVLLMGRSVLNTMGETGTGLVHCHNFILQIALESGLPGLLLALVFLVIWLIRAFRLMLDARLPLWKRLLPCVVLSLFAGEMMECTTIWFFGQPQMTLLYFLGGMIFVFSPSGSLKYAVEDCFLHDGHLSLRGWIFDRKRPLNRLDLVIRAGQSERVEEVTNKSLPREDVGAAWKSPQAARSGFVQVFQMADGESEHADLALRCAMDQETAEILLPDIRLHPIRSSLSRKAAAVRPALKANDDTETAASIRSLLERDPPRDIILAFSHCLGGGAEAFLSQKIAAETTRGGTVCVLRYDRNSDQYPLEVFESGSQQTWNLSDPSTLTSLWNTLPACQIWINEMVSWPRLFQWLEMIRGIREASHAKMILFLHDYFPLSPNSFLLSPLDYQYGFDGKHFHCDAFYAMEGFPEEYECPSVEEWRQRWGQFLRNCDEVRTFSESSRQLAKQIYPDLTNLTVVPHKKQPLPIVYQGKESANILNIGILGILANHKGRLFVHDLVELIKERKENIRIVLIGEEETGSGLPLPESAYYHQTGRYRPEELPEKVRKENIDLFLIPSVCPETFSLTTKEILEMGFPAACFDLGAQAEQIARYEKGLILSSTRPEKVLSELKAFISKLNNGRNSLDENARP